MSSPFNDDDRRRELASTRYHEFQTRRRTEGDLITWVIVLSALVGMFNIFSPSYGRRPGIALLSMIVYVVWFVILTVVAKVNVFGILWGRTIKELDSKVDERVVLLTSIVMPVMSLVLLIWDLVSDTSFGVYGILGGLFAAVLLYMIARGMRKKAVT